MRLLRFADFALRVIFAALIGLAFADDCNDASDLGLTECIASNYYSGLQWATCLTEDYIKRIGDARGLQYQCIDSRRTQCYYQCMLEVHNLESGSVSTDCSCSSSTPVRREVVLADCVSPSGLDCSWYQDCLEKRYRCSGTKYNYAISYALKFCNLYSQNYANFGSVAQSWIDATRKCLQLELVPLIRPWVSATCKDLYYKAFNSHSGCYLQPQPGVSVCQLPCRDLWNIFWLVYTGGAVWSEPTQTAKQMLDVIIGCVRSRDDVTCLSETVQRLVNFGVAAKFNYLSAAENIQEFAEKITNYLAEKFSWKQRGIDWLPFSRKATSPTPSPRQKRSLSEITKIDVQVLIVDKNSLNSSSLNFNTPSSGLSTLDAAISDVKSSVSSGGLSSISVTVNGTVVSARVSDFGRCRNIECNGTALEIAAEAPSSATSYFQVKTVPFVLPLVLLIFTNYW